MCHKAQRQLEFLRNASEQRGSAMLLAGFTTQGCSMWKQTKSTLVSLNSEGSLKCRSETIQEKVRLAIQ